jgi:hypothetical protein
MTRERRKKYEEGNIITSPSENAIIVRDTKKASISSIKFN